MATRSLGVLTLDLVAKVAGFSAGLSQGERAAQDTARRIQKSFSGLKATLAGVAGAFSVGAIVTATADAEKAFALLDNAVRASGGAAGFTTQKLVDMAGSLQKLTTYDDEAIMGMQQLLLRFQSIQGVNFERAQESVLDLATALGTDLNSAALLVGKALENPVKGMTQLARSGVVLSDVEKELVKRLAEGGDAIGAQAVLLDALQSRYAGAAEAARDTVGGALTALKNAFGDLLEGKDGVAGATDAINGFTEILQDPETIAAAQALVGVLFRIGGAAVNAASGIVKIADGIDAFVKNDSAGKLRAQIDFLERMEGRSFVSFGLGEVEAGFYGAAEGAAKLLELQEKLNREEAKSRGPGRRGGDRGVTSSDSGVDLLPSEEFDKLNSKLLEQIALFGKTGEAAKLLYQIETGGLEDVSKAEQQTLLNNAKRLDALSEEKKVQEEHFAFLANLRTEYGETVRQIEVDAMEQGEEERELLLQNAFSTIDAELDYFQDATEERVRLVQESEESIARLRASNVDQAVGLLAYLGQKQKAFAVAAVLIEKAMAIRRILQNNLVAAELAFASQLIPGDPTSLARAAAAKAAVLAQGKIAAALTAAEGALQVGGILSSGGGGSGTGNSASGGSAANAIANAPQGVTGGQVFNIEITGVVTNDVVDQLLDGISDRINGGDRVIIRAESRQGQIIREGA